MALVATPISILKFTEGEYDEDWDEGGKSYVEITIPARVKYDLSAREIEQLGEAMQLDAVIIIQQKELDNLSLEIVANDHFKIEAKEFRITKFRPVVIAGEKLGYQIGIKEVL